MADSGHRWGKVGSRDAAGNAIHLEEYWVKGLALCGRALRHLDENPRALPQRGILRLCGACERRWPVARERFAEALAKETAGA